jgi:hypothetical protein
MTVARNATNVTAQILMVKLLAANAIMDHGLFLDEHNVVSEICVSPNIETSTWAIQSESELESYHTMLASENVLRREWDTPEEDEAWAHL